MSLLASPRQPPPPPPTSPSPGAMPNGPQSPQQPKEPLSHRLNEFMTSKHKMQCLRSLTRGVSWFCTGRLTLKTMMWWLWATDSGSYFGHSLWMGSVRAYYLQTIIRKLCVFWHCVLFQSTIGMYSLCSLFNFCSYYRWIKYNAANGELTVQTDMASILISTTLHCCLCLYSFILPSQSFKHMLTLCISRPIVSPHLESFLSSW